MSVADVSVSHRLVIEHKDTATKVAHWTPPLHNVIEVDGVTFVKVGYSGDRGFARFCGGENSDSNPLRNFEWLSVALKLRTVAVNAELDRIAIDKLVGHVPGTAVKQRPALAVHASPWVEISVPAVAHGDTQLDARKMRVLFELDAKALLGFEATAANCAYVRAAMAASKTVLAGRARPAHADRLSKQTGVKGVFVQRFKTGNRSDRVRCMSEDADGRTFTHSKVFAAIDDGDEHMAKRICMNLKQHVHSPLKSDAASAPESLHNDAEAASDHDDRHEASQAECGTRNQDESGDDAPPDALKAACASQPSAIDPSGPSAAAPKLNGAWDHVLRKR
jgi:hypothetical protein